MKKTSWSVVDAKNGFSAVVDAARRGRPWTVTKHGKPAVVVVAVEESARLQAAGKAGAPRFNHLLLAMPANDGAFERLPISAARRRGRLSATLGHANADLLIAATALDHGLTVVTRDATGFAPTGVDIVNPFAE